MNQSHLDANSCSRRQTRENAWEQETIAFCFASHWWRKWRESLNQSQSVMKQNQINREITALKSATNSSQENTSSDET